MIVKRIPALAGGRDEGGERAAHARNLVEYLHKPDKASDYREQLIEYLTSNKIGDGSAERLYHLGALGFVSTTPKGQRLEMMAVAQAAVRSRNPVDHWLLSWREGELPTRKQVDQTVAMFVEHLGVDARQCIYASHGDTHNRHVHIALNRYDPVIRRMVEINAGFNKEAAHQAVALIVDRFGWKAEADARYTVIDGKPVLSARAEQARRSGDRPIRPAAAAHENRTGYKSAQHLAQDEALPNIRWAQTWDDLHAVLALRGMQYVAVGRTGAVISVGQEVVKASDVHRSVTRTALSKRLGPFQPRNPGLQILPRNEQKERLPAAFRADEYRAQVEAHRRWKKAMAEAREAGVDDTTLKTSEGVRLRSWRTATTKPPRPAADLESWLRDNDETLFAERWRNRATVGRLPALGGRPRSLSTPPIIDEYRAHRCSDGVRYARPGEATAFVDRGARIEVASTKDEALLAALKLANVRFGGRVMVRGDAAFRAQVFKVAAENGLAEIVANQEYHAQQAALRAAAQDGARAAVRAIAQPPAAARRSTEEVDNGRRAGTTALPRTRAPAGAGRQSAVARGLHRFEPLDRKLSLRRLPQFGVDRRSTQPEGLLPVLRGGDVRGRLPGNHEVRGAEPGRVSSERPPSDHPKVSSRNETPPQVAQPPRVRGGLAAQAEALGPAARAVASKGNDTVIPTVQPRGRER